MTVDYSGACGGGCHDTEWDVIVQLRREVEQKQCHIARLRADAQLLQRTDPDCLHGSGEERALRIAAAQVQLRERGETLVSQSERLRYLKAKLLDARNRTRRQLDMKLSAGCGLQAHHGSWPISQTKTSAGQERRLGELEETSSEHAQYLTEAQRELEVRCEEVRMRQGQEGRILELEGFLAEQEAALCDARDEAMDRAEELQALQRSIGLSVGSSSSRVEELREELAEMNMSYEGVVEMRALRDAISVEEQASVSKDQLIAELEERVGLSISVGSMEMHLVSIRQSGCEFPGGSEGPDVFLQESDRLGNERGLEDSRTVTCTRKLSCSRWSAEKPVADRRLRRERGACADFNAVVVSSAISKGNAISTHDEALLGQFVRRVRSWTYDRGPEIVWCSAATVSAGQCGQWRQLGRSLCRVVRRALQIHVGVRQQIGRTLWVFEKQCQCVHVA